MQSTEASPLHGDLSLADLLNVAGIATDDVLLIRHTYSADGLTRADTDAQAHDAAAAGPVGRAGRGGRHRRLR